MPNDLHEIPKFRDRLGYIYAEQCVVERNENSIALFDEEGETHIPIATLSLLMLGPGTKVTHRAMDILARNNCLVAWVGEEGVRLYSFATGGTHSSARLLRQAELVVNPDDRLRIARKLYQARFPDPIPDETTMPQLRGMEGLRVRNAYAHAAEKYGVEWQGRSYDRNQWQGSDPVNRALSAANACLYGICHAAILSLGFSPALGFIHTGKQLSFVYDLADLYKAELAIPVSFREAVHGGDDIDRRVRLGLRDTFRETKFIDRIAKDLMNLFAADLPDEEMEVYDEDPAMPAELWDGE